MNTFPALTSLETTVYNALVDAAGDNGGDFACADEVDLAELKLTSKQFGALLTTLETKRVIDVDITYINGSLGRGGRKGDKVTQVTFRHLDDNDQPVAVEVL